MCLEGHGCHKLLGSATWLGRGQEPKLSTLSHIWLVLKKRFGVSDSESWSLTRLETLGCYSPPCCAQGASDLLRSLQLLVTDRKFSPQPLAVISRSEIPMWEILPCGLPIPPSLLAPSNVLNLCITGN